MLSFGYLQQWVKVINQNFPETKKQDQKTVDVSIVELIVSFSQLGWKEKEKSKGTQVIVMILNSLAEAVSRTRQQKPAMWEKKYSDI